MKKYDGKHRKRIGRKKRELTKWRHLRASARGVSVKKMLSYLDNRADPLRHCVRINSKQVYPPQK
jgi:hypothetical protein